MAEQRAQNELLLKMVDQQSEIIQEMRSQTAMLRRKMTLQDEEIERLQRKLHDAMVTLYYTQRELDASEAELARIRAPLKDTAHLPENRGPRRLGEELKLSTRDLIGMMEFCDLVQRKEDNDDEEVIKSVPGLYQCSRCKSALYTSKEEQQADWPRHREVCTPPGAEAEAVSGREF